MTDLQKTLKGSITFSGIGLHTGKDTTVTIHPASENFGIQFRRIDIENAPLIPANADYVVQTSRGTTIEREKARVTTIEHCLAALFGMQIDNALIEMDNEEMPILDGSSKFYVEKIKEIGIALQNTQRNFYVIDKEIKYRDEEKNADLQVLPYDGMKVSVKIDYGMKVLGEQYAELRSLSDFDTEIAPCKTFVFLHELEFLLSHNLIKGGSLDNAIVFVNKVMEPEELDRLSKLFNRPSVDVHEGVLNNTKLIFENEPARHKLLDFIGDIALLGKPVKGHFIISHPGHKSNVEFAKEIKRQLD